MEDQKRELLLLLSKPHILEIIRHLNKNDMWSVSQTDLSKVVGVFTSSLQKDLAKMEKFNMLSSSKCGRIITYKIHDANAHAVADLMGTIESVVEQLDLKNYKPIQW